MIWFWHKNNKRSFDCFILRKKPRFSLGLNENEIAKKHKIWKQCQCWQFLSWHKSMNFPYRMKIMCATKNWSKLEIQRSCSCSHRGRDEYDTITSHKQHRDVSFYLFQNITTTFYLTNKRHPLPLPSIKIVRIQCGFLLRLRINKLFHILVIQYWKSIQWHGSSSSLLTSI